MIFEIVLTTDIRPILNSTRLILLTARYKFYGEEVTKYRTFSRVTNGSKIISGCTVNFGNFIKLISNIALSWRVVAE